MTHLFTSFSFSFYRFFFLAHLSTCWSACGIAGRSVMVVHCLQSTFRTLEYLRNSSANRLKCSLRGPSNLVGQSKTIATEKNQCLDFKVILQKRSVGIRLSFPQAMVLNEKHGCQVTVLVFLIQLHGNLESIVRVRECVYGRVGSRGACFPYACRK